MRISRLERVHAQSLQVKQLLNEVTNIFIELLKTVFLLTSMNAKAKHPPRRLPTSGHPTD